jgi:hypothetical protein
MAKMPKRKDKKVFQRTAAKSKKMNIAAMISVLVDGVCVATVPLWMAHHVIDDAVSRYPGCKIVLEVDQV